MCLLAPAALAGESANGLMEAGHWKRVRRLAEARLAANGNDAQAHAWLAKARITFGDMAGAVAEAERAVAIEPRSAAYQGQLAEACAMAADQSSAIRGFVYVRSMKKAIAASLALDPNHIDTLLVEMMFSWKAPAIAGGDRKKAQRIADRIQSISPAWGYLAHARLLQDSGQDAETEQLLLNAVKADPGFYRSWAALGRFYAVTARVKRYDQAERAAREAIALDAGAAAGYEILMRVYAAQRKWAELETTAARALRAVPDDLTPLYAAAQTLIESGEDFDRAEQYLNRYLAQDPEGRQPTRDEARLQLASLHRKAGLARQPRKA